MNERTRHLVGNLPEWIGFLLIAVLAYFLKHHIEAQEAFNMEIRQSNRQNETRIIVLEQQMGAWGNVYARQDTESKQLRQSLEALIQELKTKASK